MASRRLLLALALLPAAACSDDDGGGGGGGTEAFVACLAEAGVGTEADPELAASLGLDGDVLGVEVGGGALAVVDADDGSARRSFELLEEGLAQGADSLDFFREGRVTVLFSEESAASEGELLRRCAGEA